MLKICNTCGKEMPIGMFGKLTRSKDGLRPMCKDCRSKLEKEHYRNNPEQSRIRQRKYTVSNSDLINERSRNHYAQNLDEMHEQAKKYYIEHLEAMSKNQKKYNDSHIKEIKECRDNYRKNNAEKEAMRHKKYRIEHIDKIHEKDREYRVLHKEQIYTKCKIYRQNNKPQYVIYAQNRRAKKLMMPCTLTNEQWYKIKQDFNNTCAYCGKKLPLEQEHFIALTRHGEYTVNNIIPSCRACNGSKKDKEFAEWYPKFRHYSKKREKIILNYLHYDKQNIQQLTFAI